MRTTLVLPETITAQVRSSLEIDVETGAVLWANPVHTTGGNLRLLAVGFWPVPEDAYVVRTPAELLVASHGFVPPLAEIEEAGAVPIWMHTHPAEGASARRSEMDVVVDRELSELFRTRTGSPYYGALIVSRQDGQIRFTGHVDDGVGLTPVARLWLVGSELRLLRSEDSPVGETLPIAFDRQIRVFGGDIQRVVGDLSIAIVGCGGTGSAVAEQLVRLGVRRFHLFDPDTVSASNLTRLYGSVPGDVGRNKVKVVADHLRRIAPDVETTTHAAPITEMAAAKQLTEADVIFGCTDDNAGRIVLSRFSAFFLVPVIDVGVLLTSDKAGVVDGIHGRVTVLHPGGGCLICRNRVDLRRAAVELMDVEEQEHLAAEGYAPALPDTEPAVVSYTSMVAATAVSELLERLIHFGPRPSPNEVLVRAHEREISTNFAGPRPGHFCSPVGGKLGSGDSEPFLDLVWTK